MKKIIGGIAGAAAVIAIITMLYFEPPKTPQDFETLASRYFARDAGWMPVPSTSVFQTYVRESDIRTESGRSVYDRIILELDPAVNYDEVKADGRTVVVYPTFTASAYTEPGFYTFYRGECDTRCLTVQIQNNFAQPQASPNALQVFRLLNYPIITDVDIDKNPSILANYDKVILLHSEYVTKEMFDAITNHPHVIYLYPNALYAQIKPDYEKNTITLIRGHNYPENQIRNGFDWEFDNTQMEYERTCNDIRFYKISNGWMLNCWPENVIHKSLNFLKTIKDL
ncbi:MAG: hypothetical protein QXE82_04345 [Candidatus Nitrosotenuis sp.]